MSFQELTDLLVHTGRDCPVCKGTGKNPRKRKEPCPEMFCRGGKEVRPSDEEEWKRRHQV